LISIQNVTKYFKKNHLRKDDTDERFRVLDNISLTIQDGEFVSFIGPSGCGKSTLLRMIVGLLVADRGKVLVDGREIEGPGSDRMVVFQDYVLFPWMNVRNNIAAGLKIRKESRETVEKKTAWAIDLVGLGGFERSYPHQLSGGQRQRVLLAMALVNSPDLLICDEPTTALDVTVQSQVLATIDEVLDSVGAACLFITHDLAVVSHICRELIVMTSGKVVEAGSARDVLSHPDHPYTRRLLRAARLDLVEPGATIVL